MRYNPLRERETAWEHLPPMDIYSPSEAETKHDEKGIRMQPEQLPRA
jgi:hypothetical protein